MVRSYNDCCICCNFFFHTPVHNAWYYYARTTRPWQLETAAVFAGFSVLYRLRRRPLESQNPRSPSRGLTLGVKIAFGSQFMCTLEPPPPLRAPYSSSTTHPPTCTASARTTLVPRAGDKARGRARDKINDSHSTGANRLSASPPMTSDPGWSTHVVDWKSDVCTAVSYG